MSPTYTIDSSHPLLRPFRPASRAFSRPQRLPWRTVPIPWYDGSSGTLVGLEKPTRPQRRPYPRPWRPHRAGCVSLGAIPKARVTPDALALEVIDKVGPGGNYLMEDHTLAHIREDGIPTLSDRQIYENWLDDGGTTMGERVRARLLEILEDHHPAVVAPEVAEAVKAITRRAEERAPR